MKDQMMQIFRESADLKVRFIRQNADVLLQAVKMVVEAFKSGNKVPAVFTLNGLSKTCALPGLKLGWIVATGPQSGPYLEQLERSADAFLSCSQVAQAMLPGLLRSSGPFIRSMQKRLHDFQGKLSFPFDYGIEALKGFLKELLKDDIFRIIEANVRVPEKSGR
jgi:DNA-binding transcriptional MocR family regulator